MQTDTILHGDIRQIARTLPAGSVHCIVTSPPYYGLRDYGVEGQIGLEASPQEYVDELVGIFRELRRVLRDDGTVWLNLGDSYSGSWGNYGGQNRGNGKQRTITSGSQAHQKSYDGLEQWRPPASYNLDGLKPKDLMMIPARVALALQADGWWLRSDIIWAKPSPMPESVTDRPTKAHEYIFLLSKSPRYYYDQEAIKEPSVEDSIARQLRGVSDCHKNINGAPGQTPHTLSQPRDNDKSREVSTTRNRRTIWTVATQPYPGAHFATFPPDLIRPCILAGCPAKVCAKCGAPWVRVVEKKKASVTKPRPFSKNGNQDRNDTARIYEETESKTTGFRPTCNHYDHLYLQDFPKSRKARKRYQRDTSGDWWQRVRLRPGLDSWPSEPGIVFDPFMGSGTLGQVAIEVDPSRRWLGCELNQDYIDLAWDRIGEAIVTKVAGKDYYKTIREKPDSTLTYQQLGLIGGE